MSNNFQYKYTKYKNKYLNHKNKLSGGSHFDRMTGGGYVIRTSDVENFYDSLGIKGNEWMGK